MSFIWTSQAGKILNDGHINEVKTTVSNILVNDFGRPDYNWNKVPVSGDDIIKFEVLEELRGAVDYLDDENRCHTHNATERITHRTGHDSTFNTNVETGNNANNWSSYRNDHDSGDQTNNYTFHRNAPHNASFMSGYYDTHRYDHDDTRQTVPHNSGYNLSFNSSFK
jgi:hypothetical protein